MTTVYLDATEGSDAEGQQRMPTPEERLARIEQREIDNEVRLQHIADVVELVERQVKAITLELGGAPEFETRGTRPSVRERLHAVEASVTSTALLGAMSEALKFQEPQIKRMMGQALRERRNRAFTVWQKVLLFAAAIGGAVASILRLLNIG